MEGLVIGHGHKQSVRKVSVQCKVGDLRAVAVGGGNPDRLDKTVIVGIAGFAFTLEYAERVRLLIGDD